MFRSHGGNSRPYSSFYHGLGTWLTFEIGPIRIQFFGFYTKVEFRLEIITRFLRWAGNPIGHLIRNPLGSCKSAKHRPGSPPWFPETAVE